LAGKTPLKELFWMFLRMLAGRWPDDVRKEISVAGKTPPKEPFWMFFEEDGRKMAGRKSAWPERRLSKSYFGCFLRKMAGRWPEGNQFGRKDASQRAILDVFEDVGRKMSARMSGKWFMSGKMSARMSGKAPNVR
jgi:hypothetical protein